MAVDHRRRIAWSYDGGHMWTDWQVSDDLYEVGEPFYFKYGTKPSYGCNAGLVCIPHEATDGRDVLLFSTPDDPGGARVRMSVWASFDGAKTWPVKRLINEGMSAYSSVTADRDGRVYLLFERGEKELYGRGISYCATCDGPLFKGKDIVVIGGGDTALEDALFLTKFANKVTVIHRRDKLRATKILQERALANKKIDFRLNSIAVKIGGAGKVESVMIDDVMTGKESELKADGVFVLIGITPNSDIVKELVKLCPKGYVITDDEMRTSVDGIFACGDVRMKTLRQVITAAGDGATAAFSAEHYVEKLKA